mmetsp:Transcript_30511/g.74100  ORF Transcript_30511/g.74100 Transcript_30511/m.74100 type:complete len:423 (+) Transcript_30511:59-1327(+)
MLFSQSRWGWGVILLPLLVFRFTVHRGGEGHLVFVKSLAVEPQSRLQRQRQHQQSAPPEAIIQWGRSCLELHSVNLSYKQTLWRKLTSSVPRRDYALQSITLSIKGGGHGSGVSDGSIESCGQQQQSSTKSSFILLVGASSSGKSALLKVLSGSQSPTTGHVRQWTDAETGKRSATASTTTTSKENIVQAKRIILDDRTQYSTSARQKSLQERLEQRLEPYYHADVAAEQKNTMKVAASRRIIEDVAEACGLVSSSSSSSKSKPSSTRSTTKPSSLLILQKSPTELSPSEYYKFRLAEACIDSSCSNGLVCSDDPIHDDDDDDDNEKTTTTSAIKIPGPVLFLDEWFDVETSEVVQNVQPTLERIVQKLNGIVICVTHKQHLFDLTTATTKRKETSQDLPSENKHGRITRITLSGGKILSID